MQYFTFYERLGLERNTQTQIDYNIFSDRDDHTEIRHNFWGRYGEIFFQDGQITTLRNVTCKLKICMKTSKVAFYFSTYLKLLVVNQSKQC